LFLTITLSLTWTLEKRCALYKTWRYYFLLYTTFRITVIVISSSHHHQCQQYHPQRTNTVWPLFLSTSTSAFFPLTINNTLPSFSLSLPLITAARASPTCYFSHIGHFNINQPTFMVHVTILPSSSIPTTKTLPTIFKLPYASLFDNLQKQLLLKSQSVCKFIQLHSRFSITSTGLLGYWLSVVSVSTCSSRSASQKKKKTFHTQSLTSQFLVLWRGFKIHLILHLSLKYFIPSIFSPATSLSFVYPGFIFKYLIILREKIA